ncbi:enoyl-CoA hydratase [Yinghuangia sp. ASG 101]|uniref:enoyl-CoA hydratase n=1 Tax=Yinghuangia sp. ASG 101 TaxID=2896848 RepID=UPI001E44EFFD|nr:enoyl-CoA hydratase [Yinghuangia sp. ASG 101]UGQ11601.1 enoyl-CoA hydratase [Yinghuangia sp. ASG 101]
MSPYRYIRYDTVDEGRIARIVLNRPQARNAQNRGLLVELDEAFGRAESDDTVRVVVLSGEGPVFSAGHDLGTPEYVAERTPGPDLHPSFGCDGGTHTPVEMRYRQEYEHFYDNTRRWRNLRKITIAQVHGSVLSAALMLTWACDLIVAAEDTVFADVVAARLGMCGVEYFGHPWEFGPRKAKELLLTGDSVDADEAYRLGMVSKVFPADELEDRTLAFARRIAALPTMAALMVKDSVNQAMDASGFTVALDACFSLHQLNHAHWTVVSEGRSVVGTPELGMPDWRGAPGIRPARKDVV